jgi:4-hydroxybenzoate polyprenyltransferase
MARDTLALWATVRSGLGGAWRAALAFQQFIRFPAFGFTAMLPLLGAATATPRVDARQLAGLIGVALAFHCFSYVQNDVIDLPIDRRQPLRSQDLLVRGVVRPGTALTFALMQVLPALAITAWFGAQRWAYLALGTAFICMTIYNLWGKRAIFPPATDLAQGLAWAALVIYGSTIGTGRPGILTACVFTFVVAYVVLINGVPGSLRDLANDLGCGMRSTATLLGARPRDATRLLIPRRLVVYAFSLHFFLFALLLWVLLGNWLGYGVVAWALTLAALLALFARCWKLLQVVLSPDSSRAELVEAAKSYVFLSLSMPIVLFACYLDASTLTMLLLAGLVPLLPTDWGARRLRRLLDGLRRTHSTPIEDARDP